MYEFAQKNYAASCCALLAAAMLASAAGCASAPDRPERELAAAEVTIQQAQQSGAARYGSAELSAAQQKLAAARTAAEREDMESARRLAQEAALDAELASATARNRKAESAVDELNDTIEVLRQEIARNQSETGDMQ